MGRFRTLLPLIAAITSPVFAQQSDPSAALRNFDREHKLAAKERLLSTITAEGPAAGVALLRLARSTTNTDTRWMAMRGMATVHCATCGSFPEASLKDADPRVRANAARALGDLGIKEASDGDAASTSLVAVSQGRVAPMRRLFAEVTFCHSGRRGKKVKVRR